MTAIGGSAAEIAATIGCSDRHVQRLRSARPPVLPPHCPDPRLITDERCAEMDALAQRVFEWAGRLRDEDPVVTYEALVRLSRERLLEFTMVALAMVPSDATLTDLLAWILELPAAKLVDE